MSKEYSKIYTELKFIGRGNFGTAHLVRNNEDHNLYIAKKIALFNLHQKEIDQSIMEATLLKNLNSPHIVKYKNSYYDKSMLIIVMEYCESNSLLS